MDIAVRWRTILPYATQRCVSAVDRLMASSGGGAILNTSPLHRCFRDVPGAPAHALNEYDIACKLICRHLPGIETAPTLLSLLPWSARDHGPSHPSAQPEIPKT